MRTGYEIRVTRNLKNIFLLACFQSAFFLSWVMLLSKNILHLNQFFIKSDHFKIVMNKTGGYTLLLPGIPGIKIKCTAIINHGKLCKLKILS